MIEERAHQSPLAEHNFELAEIAFPRVDGLGCVWARTNLYSVPAAPGETVEAQLYPSQSKCGTKAAASPVMSAATDAANRCSTPNIIWTCWSASPARWSAPSRWPRGDGEDCGRRVMIGSSAS